MNRAIANAIQAAIIVETIVVKHVQLAMKKLPITK